MGASLQGDGWHVEEIAGGPARILARSAVAVSVTGTTNETALATIAIPAGAMGLNGGLMIYSAWTLTNSANNKILRGRLGGMSGALHLSTAVTTILSFADIRRIRNRNSASSQVGGSTAGGSSGTNTAAITTGSTDTSLAQDLVLTGQLALGSETITLENYEVWLLP